MEIFITITAIIFIILLYFKLKNSKEDEYKKGYDWAAGVILRKEYTVDDVIAYISCAEAFEGKTKFDEGALDALQAIDTLRMRTNL